MATYKPGRPNKYYPTTDKGCRPPAVPGEYRIRDREGSITYVGETCNLKRRLYQHTHGGKMSDDRNIGGTFEWKKADGRSSSATRRVHERAKIAQHKPPMNQSSGGEGRIAKFKGR